MIPGRSPARTGLTILLLVAALGTIEASPATAGGPTDALRDFFGAVNVVLGDVTTEDQPLVRLRAIRRHLDDVFDFREAAMLALGREWAVRTPVEQNEFVALFADLLERSFVWRVAGKATTAGGLKVRYLTEAVDGDAATVETAIEARDGNPLRLDVRMGRRSGRWVIRDVVMDGVSTMENYHAQFQRLARDGSWPELMEQLRAKVGAPPGTVQVATAAPTTRGPAGLTVPDGVGGAVVVPATAVPPAIARPLETAVVASRTAPYAVPPPTGPRGSIPEPREDLAADVPGANGKVAADAVAATTPPRDVVADASARPRRGEPKPTATGRAPRTATYWVQVGAYRSADRAGRVADQVKGEILVVASPAAAEPLLRVRVGPFADRAHALARVQELKARGWKVFITESPE